MVVEPVETLVLSTVETTVSKNGHFENLNDHSFKENKYVKKADYCLP